MLFLNQSPEEALHKKVIRKNLPGLEKPPLYICITFSRKVTKQQNKNFYFEGSY